MRLHITLLLLLGHGPVHAAAEPLVAVAANLAPVMESLGADFALTGGARPRLSIGSSGDLLRQVQQGAPFEIYVSASPEYTARAMTSGRVEGEPVTLARARMAAFVPRESQLVEAQDLTALGRLLAAGRYRRIALANPEVAPFGLAARQALRHMGVWAVEKDRLVMGANVAQAMQFTLAGGVDVGFVPISFTLQPDMASRGRIHPVPADWHVPLTQSMVLLRNAGHDARAFFLFLQSDAARERLARSGYEVPEQ